MPRKSHLYQFHAQNGKITEFGGFDMPLWYKGIIEEHNAVRNAAGLFDVSHMGRFEIQGSDATSFLNHVLPTDVSKIKDGRAFYSAICNTNGGIIDDTVTNKMSAARYLMVVNASNRSKDFQWLQEHSSSFSVKIEDVSDQIALIAFQGPLAIPLMQRVSDVDLDSIRRFAFTECVVAGQKCLVSRTGYTGEDGFEIAVYDTTPDNPERAMNVWRTLLELGEDRGVLPCGLGARDSLRLEAGMCLYGQDIDDSTSPIEASLATIVSLEKQDKFIGRETIENQIRNGVMRRRVAFSMVGAGIPRHGFDVLYGGSKIGRVTSGTFSPTLKMGIGMAYVQPSNSEVGQQFMVQIRNSPKAAEVVNVPFYDTSKFGYKRTKAPV